MGASVADPRLDVPRKPLALRGESLRKPLADDARAAGQALERAIELAHMTKQELARDLGYGDNQASISRWISGVENMPFARLLSHPKLGIPLIHACAARKVQMGLRGIRVKHIIEIDEVVA